jgi:hypothetical protein
MVIIITAIIQIIARVWLQEAHMGTVYSNIAYDIYGDIVNSSNLTY